MTATQIAARPWRRRHLLMCRPTYFDVTYAINPWMDPAQPTDTCRAVEQWQTLRDLYRRLGHTVSVIEPDPELPDMVYAANGATVIEGRVLGARFLYPQRAGEGAAYLDWFRTGKYECHDPQFVNEGEGDLLLTARGILAGYGFRTSSDAHAEASAFFGLPVISLELVDPRFYHLDTALAVLAADEIMYNPAAFSAASRSVLEELFPTALQVGPVEADLFALNVVSDGQNVVLPPRAFGVAQALRERGYEPIHLDLSELLKGGGGAKCCTLFLRE